MPLDETAALIVAGKAIDPPPIWLLAKGEPIVQDNISSLLVLREIASPRSVMARRGLQIQDIMKRRGLRTGEPTLSSYPNDDEVQKKEGIYGKSELLQGRDTDRVWGIAAGMRRSKGRQNCRSVGRRHHKGRSDAQREDFHTSTAIGYSSNRERLSQE